LPMLKVSLRVRRLTLVSSETKIEVVTSPDDARNNLDHKRLTRIIELSTATSSTRRKLDKIHGVEPEFKSKFWANEDDEESESKSEDDDISTPTLLREVVATGFTTNQLWQTEEELTKLTPTKTEVTNPLPHDSISANIIDVWIRNQ
jgi:hypothetical protein